MHVKWSVYVLFHAIKTSKHFPNCTFWEVQCMDEMISGFWFEHFYCVTIVEDSNDNNFNLTLFSFFDKLTKSHDCWQPSVVQAHFVNGNPAKCIKCKYGRVEQTQLLNKTHFTFGKNGNNQIAIAGSSQFIVVVVVAIAQFDWSLSIVDESNAIERQVQCNKINRHDSLKSAHNHIFATIYGNFNGEGPHNWKWHIKHRLFHKYLCVLLFFCFIRQFFFNNSKRRLTWQHKHTIDKYANGFRLVFNRKFRIFFPSKLRFKAAWSHNLSA